MKTVLSICGAIILAALVLLCGIVLSSILFPVEGTPGWFIGTTCVVSIAVLVLAFIKVFKRKGSANKNTDFILENAPSTSVPTQNPVPHHSPELYDIEKEDELGPSIDAAMSFIGISSKPRNKQSRSSPAPGRADSVFIPEQKEYRTIEAPPESLSFAEKERFIAERVTTDDMLQFTAIPYDLNTPLQKSIPESGRPRVFIYLDRHNQAIAIRDLESLNQILLNTKGYHASKKHLIDTRAVIFYPGETRYDCSRLVCTPYSFDGTVADMPLCLRATSDFDNISYAFTAFLYYDLNGKVAKADVHVFRHPIDGSRGYYFETVDGRLLLYKVKSSENPDKYGQPDVVYRDPHLIAIEAAWAAKREQEEQDYAWVQQHLPDMCPKTITGFRRMKTQNTKNFQAIRTEAASLGRNI